MNTSAAAGRVPANARPSITSRPRTRAPASSMSAAASGITCCCSKGQHPTPQLQPTPPPREPPRSIRRRDHHPRRARRGTNAARALRRTCTTGMADPTRWPPRVLGCTRRHRRATRLLGSNLCPASAGLRPQGRPTRTQLTRVGVPRCCGHHRLTSPKARESGSLNGLSHLGCGSTRHLVHRGGYGRTARWWRCASPCSGREPLAKALAPPRPRRRRKPQYPMIATSRSKTPSPNCIP
jgi:hypothetical protein